MAGDWMKDWEDRKDAREEAAERYREIQEEEAYYNAERSAMAQFAEMHSLLSNAENVIGGGCAFDDAFAKQEVAKVLRAVQQFEARIVGRFAEETDED